jgi:hypothetical protein
LRAAQEWRSAQTDTDLTKHRYVLGVPGTGKSMGLVGFLRESVRRQHAAVWVSTHGAKNVMRYLPEDLEVHYFSPTRGKGINLLRRYTHTSLEKTVLASQCITVFRRLFGSAMGEGMIEYAHAGALALLEEGERDKKEVTLLDLFRRLKLENMDTASEVIAHVLENRDKRTHDAALRRLARMLASDVLMRCLSSTGRTR